MTLHSFQRYLDAGVTLALGTDTYPLDMVSELRWASILAKVTDGNYQAGLARDVFNAATVGGCRFLGREDLGRLAAGAKADILLINLDHVGGSALRGPDQGPGGWGVGPRRGYRDRGRQVLVQGGRATRVDEAAVYAKAREVTQHYWSRVPSWRWDGATVDQIVPPAFPIHRTARVRRAVAAAAAPVIARAEEGGSR